MMKICWRKTTPRLRTVSDGNVSLPSSLTRKWLMTQFRCCVVPILMYVLSGLSLSLFDSIKNKMSVRQSLNLKTDSCAFDYESGIQTHVSSAYR